jgi:hypothetical protein
MFPAFREFARTILPTGKGVMALFRAYFDDSGTHAGSSAVVFGGLVGTDDQWETFDAAWRAKLAAPLPGKPRLRKFHLSSCMAAEGEFRDYKPVERDAVAGEFRDIIIKSSLASTASAIDRVAWDELVVGPVKRLLGSPLQPCFLKCIDRAVEFTRSWGNGDDHLAVMFDEGIKCDELSSLINKYLWNMSEVVSVTFGRVESFAPLQGADTIATESYWQSLKTLGGTPEEMRLPFQHYLRHARSEGLMFDRQAIIDELRRRDERGFLKTA